MVSLKIRRCVNNLLMHLLLYLRRESNPNLKFRKLSFYPLNYRDSLCFCDHKGTPFFYFYKIVVLQLLSTSLLLFLISSIFRLNVGRQLLQIVFLTNSELILFLNIHHNLYAHLHRLIELFP